MRRKPSWLKVKLPSGKKYKEIMKLVKDKRLHTVCQEAKCPNIAECFSSGTATFMILGDRCTRNCKYCNVKYGTPLKVDKNEPKDVANAVKSLGLKYAVITSVTRDDLDDFGADQFAKTIEEIRRLNDQCGVEVLIPDFNGDIECLKKVIDASPDVINHNIEVVKDLFPNARPQGDYSVSIELLEAAKEINSTLKTKSGLMVGLGETYDEILETLKDLRTANVDIITIGQYLQPNKNCLPVAKYYTPAEFKDFEKVGLNMGFEKVISGALVRSSYHAGEYYQ